MAENQVQSEKKMTSLNVSSETRDAIKGISTSLGLSQADTVARLVDGYHPNATPGVKAALDASAVLDEAVERVKRIIVGAAEAAAMELVLPARTLTPPRKVQRNRFRASNLIASSRSPPSKRNSSWILRAWRLRTMSSTPPSPITSRSSRSSIPRTISSWQNQPQKTIELKA